MADKKDHQNPYRNIPWDEEDTAEFIVEFNKEEMEHKGRSFLMAVVVVVTTIVLIATQCTPAQGPPPPVKPDTPQVERMIYAAV